jgi:hypothetical protein
MNNGAMFEGIYVTTTANDRRALVEYYRNEIINDKVRDLTIQHNLGNLASTANDLNFIEMQDAIRTRGHLIPRLHAHVNDIRRHDWDRKGNCIYILHVEGNHFRSKSKRAMNTTEERPRIYRQSGC